MTRIPEHASASRTPNLRHLDALLPRLRFPDRAVWAVADKATPIEGGGPACVRVCMCVCVGGGGMCVLCVR